MDHSRKYPVTTNYYVEMVRGRIRGAIPVHKFGLAIGIDTADGIVSIWDGMEDDLPTGKITTYTLSTTADIVDMVATDATYIGYPMEIHGLDANLDYWIQTVDCNGQTPVTLPIPLIRVFRVKVANGVEPTGHVFVSTGVGGYTAGVPNTPASIRAIVHGGRNQTQMAMYSVPRGYTLYADLGWSNMAGKLSGSTSVLYIKTNEIGHVPRELHRTAMATTGSSHSLRPYSIPIPIREKHDLMYYADSSANDGAVAAGFHGMLLREDYENSSPIQTITQELP